MGQELEARVVTIDRGRAQNVALSIKQLTATTPGAKSSQISRGSRHSGTVKNLTNYGVFVELEDGIGGMVHISDLSWTKRYSHPSEFTKVGARSMWSCSKSTKTTARSPSATSRSRRTPGILSKNVFPVGSYHEATVLRRDDKGAIVQLPHGLEAFAPIKHIKKEDGSMAEPEEVLTVKVIEFNRDDKRILVSHTALPRRHQARS
jgi:small subunit ribosomal protein S1